MEPDSAYRYAPVLFRCWVQQLYCKRLGDIRCVILGRLWAPLRPGKMVDRRGAARVVRVEGGVMFPAA